MYQVSVAGPVRPAEPVPVVVGPHRAVRCAQSSGTQCVTSALRSATYTGEVERREAS